MNEEQRRKWEQAQQKAREQKAREDVPPEVEERPDGTWIARKLGCTGMGTTKAQAIFDLDYKVEIAHGNPMPAAIRDKLVELQPGVEKLMDKIFGKEE